MTALLAELARAPSEPGVELPAFHPGQIIGRFELLREIGRGGFGKVFEARDRELGGPALSRDLVHPDRVLGKDRTTTPYPSRGPHHPYR